MSRHSYLALVVAVLLIAACGGSAQDRFPIAAREDTYAVKEAALSYVIREFAPSGRYRLAITDSEYSERLVAALSGSTAGVFNGPGEWHVENGAYFDSETGLPVVLLSAEIRSLGPRRATIETAVDAGLEGENWYIVHLRNKGLIGRSNPLSLRHIPDSVLLTRRDDWITKRWTGAAIWSGRMDALTGRGPVNAVVRPREYRRRGNEAYARSACRGSRNGYDRRR